MWLCYLIACLPMIFGAVMWIRRSEITFGEWALAAGAGFLVALICHVSALWGMTADTETWSGHVLDATHHPWWRAEWTETETETDSKGNVTVRIVHKSKDHQEYWSYDASFGQGRETIEISRSTFDSVLRNFGGKIRTTTPHKPDFAKGDRNEYVADNATSFFYPAHKSVRFSNRIKAAPSVFSYAKVPAGAGVFEYPYVPDGAPPPTGRLMGLAVQIGGWDWDILNAELGPRKQVNLICIGFGDKDSSVAHLQEAHWIGGKKNDLVLCFGGPDPANPSWAYCFGWTEDPLVRRDLESLLVSHVIDPTIIPEIKKEVLANYRRKDWHSFDYITVEPPGWVYTVEIIVILLTQGGIWYWNMTNEYEKGGRRNRWDRFASGWRRW